MKVRVLGAWVQGIVELLGRCSNTQRSAIYNLLEQQKRDVCFKIWYEYNSGL